MKLLKRYSRWDFRWEMYEFFWVMNLLMIRWKFWWHYARNLLEKMRDPQDVRGIETTEYTQVCLNGWSRWLRWEVQASERNLAFVYGFRRSASVDMILGKSGYISVAVRRISPAPFYLFNQSWIHFFPSDL